MTTAFGAGSLGDVPVRGDFDGDGRPDIAVYRTPEARWFILRSSDGVVVDIAFGAAHLGDVPVPGGYDGDGITDLAIYRQTSGVVLLRSRLGFAGPIQFGAAHLGDTPVPADYNGDGLTVSRSTVGPPANGSFASRPAAC